MQDLNISNRISQNYSLLSKKEKAIADFVLTKQAKIDDMSIQDLAAAVHTSNATITRFCHKLSYRSFAEFKTKFFQEQHIKPTTLQIPSKIADYYSRLISSSAELIEPAALKDFLKRIRSAKRIIICGLGSSGLTATEFKYQLMRMNFNVDAITDPHMMLMNSALLDKEDLLIGISNSGETTAVIDAVKIAKNEAASIFSITNRNHTTLTNLSDGVLFTSGIHSIPDERFINSQLAIHFIIDIVCYTLLEEDTYFASRKKTLETLKKNQTTTLS
ncbi:MurR/RpiR family transcriptional regulator [Carnobacterium gallinarum]|uniref:MurR/RpiR family transcriptional regulator n=1 Tax=Carnobacterium gallinarum TaxID=2749 RepID=UPI00055977E6|nr:MurR/RpiR family transcriptional regulator [Carnobacterium gallinarum]